MSSLDTLTGRIYRAKCQDTMVFICKKEMLMIHRESRKKLTLWLVTVQGKCSTNIWWCYLMKTCRFFIDFCFFICITSELEAEASVYPEILTAPQGPNLHCDGGRVPRIRSVLPGVVDFFRVSWLGGKGAWSLGWGGHWVMAHSCSVAGRSSGSHSLTSSIWSLKFTQRTWRDALPWPQETEHCGYNTHPHTK